MFLFFIFSIVVLSDFTNIFNIKILNKPLADSVMFAVYSSYIVSFVFYLLNYILPLLFDYIDEQRTLRLFCIKFKKTFGELILLLSSLKNNKSNYTENNIRFLFLYKNIINDLKVLDLSSNSNLNFINDDDVETFVNLNKSKKNWVIIIHHYTNEFIKNVNELLSIYKSVLPDKIYYALLTIISDGSLIHNLFKYSIIEEILFDKKNIDKLLDNVSEESEQNSFFILAGFYNML